ncbi:hypothetical protein JJJA_0043 [Achromobacter phage JWDelta]|uniref:Uncharacterized protein n=2 Tax=Jwalphavirus jwalpha TaxID=2169963 RepID=V9VEI1_9CAUD|nr:hypothetical protein CH29_gp46 [Achromobacter phage JWAlpha]AHC56559.1 hypothetical protein JJJA_0043 [Achromobacter phage JWDelta]AHC93999.1 hypothetical protein JJJB_0046 [Achromobacter phage JWAlpha]
MRHRFLMAPPSSVAASKTLDSVRDLAREFGWKMDMPVRDFLRQRLEQAKIADRWEEDSLKGQ